MTTTTTKTLSATLERWFAAQNIPERERDSVDLMLATSDTRIRNRSPGFTLNVAQRAFLVDFLHIWTETQRAEDAAARRERATSKASALIDAGVDAGDLVDALMERMTTEQIEDVVREMTESKAKVTR